MLIGTRTLYLARQEGEAEVAVRVFAPEPTDADWSCRYEIAWPGETWTRAAHGIDAVQALELALRMIGADLYTSEPHKAGTLRWTTENAGYGFPVPANLRDLLVGEDRQFQ